MKKNTKWIFIVVGILIIAAIAIYFLFFSNQVNRTPYSDFEGSSGSRVSVNVQNEQNADVNNNSNNNTISKPDKVIGATEGIEKEISSFSTKIMEEDNNRDNNMKLSLAKLNGTIVKKGDTFSFNKVVGSPTPDKGYEKAGVFVEDDYKKDYGGGNCQVSTTLYNAVLKAKDLKVTERHEHTQEVYYVPLGKDAAVAYR